MLQNNYVCMYVCMCVCYNGVSRVYVCVCIYVCVCVYLLCSRVCASATEGERYGVENG